MRLVEQVSRPDTADLIDRLGGAGLAPQQAYGMLNQLINQQAFTLAALDLFYGSAILLVLLIPLVLLARPSRQSGEAAASGAH